MRQESPSIGKGDSSRPSYQDLMSMTVHEDWKEKKMQEMGPIARWKRMALSALLLQFPFRARVLQVRDGDSLTVRALGWLGRIAQRTFDVRLHGIDAPEFPQPGSSEARQRLASLVLGQEIRVFPRGGDAYGRLIARVRCQGRSPALILVREGLAWPTSPTTWIHSLPARMARRGVHGDFACLHPRDWRRVHRGRGRPRQLRSSAGTWRWLVHDMPRQVARECRMGKQAG